MKDPKRNEQKTQKIKQAEEPQSRRQLRKERKQEKRREWNNLVKYNQDDLHYHAPFGIMHLKIFAWLFIVLAQYAITLRMMTEVHPDNLMSAVGYILTILAQLSVPCFLLASFSHILQNREHCVQILLGNILGGLGIMLAYYLIVFHYGAGISSKLTGTSFEVAVTTLSRFLLKINTKVIHINIFIDLILCTQLAFFLTADPPKLFKNREKLFRCGALLPIIYGVVLVLIKTRCIFQQIDFPAILYPMMPTKAPATFIAFFLIVLLQSREKKRYYALGGTKEGYIDYLKTNRHSFGFAKSTAKIFAIVGLVDLVCLIVVGGMYIATEKIFFLQLIYSINLGESIGLLLLAPFILLFSYNKTYKNSTFDLVLPMASIGMIVWVYIDFVYKLIMDFL